MAIASLVPNPRNPRRHPEKQLDHLVSAVRRFGQMRRILVRADNNMIIGGAGLVEACRRAGMVEVDAAFADWDQDTADAYMIADNRLAQLGEDDEDALAALLRDLDPDIYESVGFDEKSVEKLFADDDTKEVIIREVDASTIYDQFWITARGPLEQQADVLLRMRQLMSEFPGVEVDLGTINLDDPG